MTTLTRTRKEEEHAGFPVTFVSVSGAEGAVTLYTNPFTSGVAWCTSTERPGYELTDDCPVRGGKCWGDAYLSAVSRRVFSALWSGGFDAAYVVLEELYRREFGGAVLIIGDWHSWCGACGQSADPAEKRHRTNFDAPDPDRVPGCNVVWTHVAADVSSRARGDRIRRMRPDLVYLPELVDHNELPLDVSRGETVREVAS